MRLKVGMSLVHLVYIITMENHNFPRDCWSRWKPGENPSKEQMIEAANRYCEKMGASPENHQIVVFQHNDRPHKHIHVYINRMPVGRGKALETSHDYARNVRVCKEVSRELGFARVAKLAEGKLRHLPESRKEALKQKCDSLEEFERRLMENSIACNFTIQSGQLKYSSYSYRGMSVRGQDVGFTATNIQKILDRRLEVKKTCKQALSV